MRTILTILALGFGAMAEGHCQLTTETSSLSYVDNPSPYGFGQPVLVHGPWLFVV